MPNRSRRRQQASARGCADQRKRRQVEAHRSRRRTFADHDVDRIVFHGGVEHFLDRGRQAMDFVNEQDIIGFEIGKDRHKVTRLGDDRARRRAKSNAQFLGENLCERGLAEPGRPEQQCMVEGFAAAMGGFDIDAQV